MILTFHVFPCLLQQYTSIERLNYTGTGVIGGHAGQGERVGSSRTEENPVPSGPLSALT